MEFEWWVAHIKILKFGSKTTHRRVGGLDNILHYMESLNQLYLSEFTSIVTVFLTP